MAKIEQILKKASAKVFGALSDTNKALSSDGLTYFKSHVVGTSLFDYKKYENQINPFFSKWGFKFSMIEASYYENVNGIKSNLYIPISFYFNLLNPFLNNRRFDFSYQDKNYFYKVLGAYRENKKYEFCLPDFVAYCINGFFYNGDEELCTREEAVQLVMDCPEDLILKPTINTMGGAGVCLIKAATKDKRTIETAIDNVGPNFTFQKLVKQHHLLATFNQSSLNTIRMITYRNPQGEIRVVHSFLRFGGKDSFVDNASAGGGFIGIRDNGDLISRKYLKKLHDNTDSYFDDSVTNTIPYFDRLKEVAKYLHEGLPYFNLLGWDLTVTEEGIPCIIEFNTRVGITGLQMCCGPLFTEEELNELMPKVIKYKVINKMMTIVGWNDKPGFRNVTNKLSK